MTDFLAAQGYHLPGEDPLRRRFANALQWFTSLQDSSKDHVDCTLQEIRRKMVPESSNISLKMSPEAHCTHTGSALGAQNEEVDNEEIEDSGNEGVSTHKRRRESEEHDHIQPIITSSRSLSRPTEYLRARCPLCFGGKHW